MKITRISLFTNLTHTREIDITPVQLEAWETGTHIQVAAPHLNPDDREFVMTGVTPEEWGEVMEPEDR